MSTKLNKMDTNKLSEYSEQILAIHLHKQHSFSQSNTKLHVLETIDFMEQFILIEGTTEEKLEFLAKMKSEINKL